MLMAPTGTYIEANGLKVYYEVYGEGLTLADIVL
jgi:hypothetical protein